MLATSSAVRGLPGRNWRLGDRAIRLAPALAMAALLLVWEAVVRVFRVPIFLLPAPSGVVRKFLSNPGLIGEHLLFTTIAAVSGFAIAVVFVCKLNQI